MNERKSCRCGREMKQAETNTKLKLQWMSVHLFLLTYCSPSCTGVYTKTHTFKGMLLSIHPTHTHNSRSPSAAVSASKERKRRGTVLLLLHLQHSVKAAISGFWWTSFLSSRAQSGFALKARGSSLCSNQNLEFYSGSNAAHIRSHLRSRRSLSRLPLIVVRSVRHTPSPPTEDGRASVCKKRGGERGLGKPHAAANAACVRVGVCRCAGAPVLSASSV